LAHAGEAGAGEWERQELPRRELYWDRARYLSVERRDFAAAAVVYDACARRFPDDDYALHYRAYNHHKAAGRVTPQILADYQQAVDRVEDNPWWNSRLITALIAANRPIEARRKWAEAIDKIDPEGTLLERDPWLATHLHYWVAKAWLDSGAWCTARSILAVIPDHILAGVARERVEIERMQAQISEAAQTSWREFDAWLEQQTSPQWAPVAGIVAQLRNEVPDLPPPIAQAGEDGPNLAWSRPGVYVEVEFVDGGLVDWFARDRIDDRRDGAEAAPWSDGDLIQWLERAAHE
jgi:hypothetical protein